MKVVIIEDEKPAAEKLQKAIQKFDSSVEVIAVLTSVKTSVDWFQKNTMPDLLLMDIELGDGLSFQILDKVDISSPVIFCTAFDEYWQEAFERNGIDYLLKPVKQDKLEIAFKKYDKLKQHFATNFHQMMQAHNNPGTITHKKRFLVKRGMDYISVRTEDISYFYATHKLVCMVDQKNQKFILDQSLADIEKQVDPSQFYRVNRKFLVQLAAIKKIKSYPKSKLQLEVVPEPNEEIIISQENVSAFKEWMGQ